MVEDKEKEVVVDAPKGAFFDSLTRNNRQIRQDRALAISEDVHLLFKRTVEDIEMRITRMKREQENMLDLSPTNAQSLVLATDFNAEAFTQKDIELGVKIRNEEIRLQIARTRFQYLFEGDE